MTSYDLLRRSCGLSQREAAELHGVALQSVKSWCSGINRPPAGVIAELRALYETIARTAGRAIYAIVDEPGAVVPAAGAAVEIGYPADDHEARALGFPCVGAWRAMAGMVIAELDRPMRLVPRGSTPATVAAIEARDI